MANAPVDSMPLASVARERLRDDLPELDRAAAECIASLLMIDELNLHPAIEES